MQKLKTNPNSFIIKLQLAIAMKKNGQFKKAIQLFQQLLTYQGQLKGHIYKNLADIYFQLENYQKALQNYRKLYGYTKNKMLTLYCIAQCYDELNQVSKCIKVLKKTLIFTRPKTYDYLGWYLIKNNYIIQGIDYLQKAFQLNREDKQTIKHLSHAYLLLQDQQKNQTAIKYLAYIIKQNPKDKQLLLLLSSAYDKRNEIDKAIKIAELANCNQLKDQVTLYILASLYLKSKSFDKGIQYLMQSLQINSQYCQSLIQLATIYSSLKQYNKSDQLFNKIILLYPQNQLVKIRYAKSFQQRQQYRQAIKLYQKVYNNGSNNILVQQRIAQCYKALQNTSMAKSIYKKLLIKQRKIWQAWLGLAIIYQQQRQYEYSLQNYLQAQKIHYQLFKNVKNIIKKGKGNCYLHLQNFQLALKCFEQLLQNSDDYNPDNLYHLYFNIGKQQLLGHCYFGLNQYKLSYSYYQQALKINPNNYQIYYNMGLAYLKQRLYKKSQQAFQKAIIINSQFSKAYYNLGNINVIFNQPDKAFIYFQKALSLDNYNIQWKQYVVDLYFSYDKYHDGIKHLQIAFDLTHNVQIAVKIAQCYCRIKDNIMFKQYLKKIEQISPNHPYLSNLSDLQMRNQSKSSNQLIDRIMQKVGQQQSPQN